MTLKISNISKRYNDKWILRDVSFDLERGKILGLIGENSSGKSTLLRIIHGSEKSNGGELIFDGNDLTDVVLVSNNHSKGWKNLFSKTDEVSASERQIKTFEDAITQAKSILLLDNPFTNLDRFQKEYLLDKLKQLVSDKQLAVIFTSNNHKELFAVCDEIAVLADSYLSQIGTPREIYEKPNSVASARSFGNCNLIVSRRVTFNNQTSLEFHTLTGDHRLQVDKTDKSMLGAITNNVTLAIRPEHISISFGASFPEDNLLKAEIVGIDYQGATTRIKLSANGLLLESLVLRLVGLKVGDECMVGLPPNRILVLKQ